MAPYIIRSLDGVEQCMSAMHLLGQNFGTSISCRYICAPHHDDHLTQSQIVDEFNLAISCTILRHPVLRVGLVDENTRRPAFVELGSIELERHIDWRIVNPYENYHTILRKAVIAQLDTKFSEQNVRPGWRITVLQQNAPLRLEVIFTWNHPAMDGMGGKLFHETLLRYLNEKSDDLPDIKDNILQVGSSASGFPPSQAKMSPFPVTFDYLLRTLWNEFKPQALHRRSGNLATWAPIKMRPHASRFERITIDNCRLQHVLSACRQHRTTLTGLLHSLVLVSLASLLPVKEAQAFVSQTALNMRPYIQLRSPNLDPGNTMSNIFSAMSHNFDKRLVRWIRSQSKLSPLDPNYKSIMEHVVWSVAATVKSEICQARASGTKNNIIGVMKYIPDWRNVVRARARKSRSVTWLISNLGVLDGGCHEQQNWSIDSASFAICAVVTGAAIQICPISIKNGGLCIDLIWQYGIVDDTLGTQLAQNLDGWLLHFGKGTSVVP